MIDAPEKVVAKYHTAQISTVPQLYAALGDDILDRWQALGQQSDKIQWEIGKEADALIAEDFRPMLVYKAIALKVGRSSETVRQCYYTFKSFDGQIREKYHLVPYTVFNRARMTDNKIEVLEHYLQSQSVDEVETVFPIAGDKSVETDFRKMEYPRCFYGIYRETYYLPDARRVRISELLNEIKKLMEDK